MPFTFHTKVRFADVDPAGIVFYPRYFEMLNAAVEDWFAGDLGLDFATLHLEQRIGVPTVNLEVMFEAPSMLGDRIAVAITPTTIGRTSCGFTAVFAGESGDRRLIAKVVLVCMDLDRQRPVEWPESIRRAIEVGMAPAA